MEFLKGRWYKRIESPSFTWMTGYLLYVKYLEYKSKDTHPFKYSQRINYGGQHIDGLNDCVCEGWQLVENSEISQYLPEGHEDRAKPEPIIGNWYKLVAGRSTISSNWLIKFNGWPGNILNAKLAICENKAYRSGNFGSKGMYNLEPIIDMSIVYREYPEEKPKDEFLIGDILTDGDAFFDYKGLGVSNTLYTSGFRLRTKIWSNGNQFSFVKKDLRKCTEEEITWYNKCKEKESFIPKEEALKSPFIGKKRIEDLKYPDVVHVSTKEQWTKVNALSKLTPWADGYFFYLIGGEGFAKERKQYENMGAFASKYNYTIYEFEDVIFSESKIEVKLAEFPKNGSCKSIDDRIEDYLKNVLKLIPTGSGLKATSKGTAWNNSYYWFFSTNSDKPEYSIEALNPLLSEIKIKPMETQELSSLPDKWFIIPTQEQWEEVKSWANRRYTKLKNAYGTYTWHNTVNFNHEGVYRSEQDCTLITFEQFKKWVLKSPIVEDYKLNDWIVISEWVGCWSSSAGGDYPVAAKYPLICKIENMKVTDHIAIFDGKYGHNLSELQLKGKVRKALPHEIPGAIKYVAGMDPYGTPEQLIEEAKKHYPVGTVFNSLGGYTNRKITESTIFEWCYSQQINVSDRHVHLGELYNKLSNRWAEVVSSPAFDQQRLQAQISLIRPKEGEKMIDTSVNKVQSISGKLVKPKKVVYF